MNQVARRRAYLSLATATLAGLYSATAARAQHALTTGTYNQNFDTLASTPGSIINPSGGIFVDGWSFLEAGSNANTTYGVDTGGSSTGNTYSYGILGANPVTDRAFGMLQSGNLQSILGFKFTNSTSSTIVSLSVSFNGEEWRKAAAADTLQFSYQAGDAALNASSGWTGVSGLDFSTPVTGTAGATDGNSSVNRTAKSATINGLAIAPGATFTFRWVDPTAASSQGMGIDDFALTPTLAAADLYWDTNGAPTGLGGDGAWNNANTNWNADSTGTGATTNWSPISRAIFAAATPAQASTTVTIDAAGITENGGVKFAADGYTLTGGALTVGATGTLFDVTNASDTGTIASAVQGSAGLTKVGAGNLVLTSASNGFTGTVTITAGTLTIGAAGDNLGNTSNNVALNGGALRVTSTIGTAPRTLSGNGIVDVSGGASNLKWNGNATVGSVSLTGTGALELAGATNTATNIVLSNTGGLKLTGGDLVMSGANTVSSTISSGLVTISGPSAVDFGSAAGSVSVATGGTLQAEHLKSSNTSTGITKVGGGTLALSGDQAGVGIFRLGLAGTTSADGGYISISSDGALGTGNFLFNNGTLNSSVPVAVANNFSIGGGQLGNGAVIDGDVTVNGGVALFKPTGTTMTHKIMVPAARTVTFNGSLGASTGTGTSNGLTLLGDGELIVNNAANAIAEMITVSGPTLTINGNLSAANVNLSSGTIRGHGSMQVLTATGGGSVSPGSPSAPAALTTNGFTFSGTTTLTIKLAGHTTPGVDYDQVVVGASATTVDIGGATLNLLHLGGYLPDQDHRTYTIVDNRSAQPVTGNFSGLLNGNGFQVDGQWYQIRYNVGVGGNDVVIESVPEPTTISLLSFLGGTALLRRRRNQAK
jgi:autotransporter-associated beta strand protein